MDSAQNRLEKLRAEIDAIDGEIINCLERRMKVVEAIGRVKHEMGIEARQENRRQEVLGKWKSQSSISGEAVENIYQAIHDAAVEVQEKI